MSSGIKLRPFYPESVPASSLSLAGWALFTGSMAAFLYICLPTRLTETEWELIVMGRLIDNSLIPLLGIALIFHGRESFLPRLHLVVYRLLLLVALALGVFYLAMIPLALRDSERMSRTLNGRLLSAEAARDEQLKKVDKVLGKATTVQELQMLCVLINLSPAIDQRRTVFPTESFEETRKWLWKKILSSQQEQSRLARDLLQRNKTELTKDSVKINVGAALASLFYLLFVMTHWGVFRSHVEAEQPT